MLDFMGEYVVDHFSHKEGVMTRHYCSVPSNNKSNDQNLFQKYTSWRKDYEASGASPAMVRELHSSLKDCLVSHIKMTDSCLNKCVEGQLLKNARPGAVL